MSRGNRYEYTRKGESKPTAVLINAWVQCYTCGVIKPMVDVGLRMVDGVIRNQPNCGKCRTYVVDDGQQELKL